MVILICFVIGFFLLSITVFNLYSPSTFASGGKGAFLKNRPLEPPKNFLLAFGTSDYRGVTGH
jgi:hypothetical protein